MDSTELILSVVIPIYNSVSYIDDLVRSIYQGGLSNDEFEVIIVDDGSNDGSSERCDELSREHHNLRVIHTPNSGTPSRPRNIGIDEARGEYLFFADSDDTLTPFALSEMMRHARKKRFDIGLVKIDGSQHGYTYDGLFDESQDCCTIENSKIMNSLGPYKLIKRQLLIESGIRFPESVAFEDLCFSVRCYFAARGKISVLADRIYYVYRKNELSLSYAVDRGEKGIWGSHDAMIDGVEHYLNVCSELARPEECPHIYLRGIRYGLRSVGQITPKAMDKLSRLVREYTSEEVRSLMPLKMLTICDAVMVGVPVEKVMSLWPDGPHVSFRPDGNALFYTVSNDQGPVMENSLPRDMGFGREKLCNPHINRNCISSASFEGDSFIFGGRAEFLRSASGPLQGASLLARSRKGGFECRVPVDLVVNTNENPYASVWHYVFEWSGRMPLAELEADGGADALDWFLELHSAGGTTIENRIGHERDRGVWDRFASAAMAGEAVLYAPTETKYKNMSHNRVPKECIAEDPFEVLLEKEKKTRQPTLIARGRQGFDNYPETCFEIWLEDRDGNKPSKFVLLGSMTKGARRGDRELKGSFELADLSKGSWRLLLRIRVGDTIIERTSFVMGAQKTLKVGLVRHHEFKLLDDSDNDRGALLCVLR